MAKIKKGGQAKPIANNRLSRSWGRPVHTGVETFRLMVEMEPTPKGFARFASLEMNKKEALDTLQYFAVMLAPGRPKRHPSDMIDRLSAPEALRKLADMIERGEITDATE